MIILLTLITMVIILTAFVIIGLATAGASFIIIFGDVIIAIVIKVNRIIIANPFYVFKLLH